MSLLAPLFLFAVPILGLPVLLHFYRGRRPEAIEWGAMEFLVDAVQEGRRWEKLEELLLMLLRVLALAALVFALARPMAPGSWLGGAAPRDVVLVLDNSLSTAALAGDEQNPGATVFDEIKRSAHDTIDGLGAGDRVQLLAAAGSGRWLTADAVAATADGRRRLHAAVDKLKPTLAAADLPAALRAAQRLAATEGSSAKRVWLFTDGQRHGMRPSGEPVWAGLAEPPDTDAPPVAMQVVLCGAGAAPPDNLSVASVEADSLTLRPGQRASLRAAVVNHGEAPSDGLTLRWRLGGEEVATSRVGQIAPGGEATTRASLEMAEPGIHLVECRITTDDGLLLDQSAELVLRVADSSPVLIVGGADAEGPGDLTDADLFVAALGFDPGAESRTTGESAAAGKGERDEQAWRAEFSPEVLAPERFDQAELSGYAAVVVTDPSLLEAGAVDRLAAYVAAGGGVWVTLGPGVDPARFNTLWHDDGEGLCPVAVEDQIGGEGQGEVPALAGGEQPAIGVHPPAADHPATRHLANTNGLDIDRARFDEHWRLARETPLGDPASVLLKSGAGDPLAVERYLGQGRVIVLAAPLGFSWSNLPQLKAFVVMVNDWLRYLSAASRDRHNLAPGAPIVAASPETDRLVEATVRLPAGDEVPLASRGEGEAAVFRYTQTTMPGTYRVVFKAGGEPVLESPFVAARDPRESDLARLSDAEAGRITAWSGVAFGAVADPADPAAGEVAARQPVWWALLVALVLLMAGELLLSTRVANRRQPPAAA